VVRVQCGVDYYSPSFARGMVSMRCHHAAKFTVVDPPIWSAEKVCGIHARVVQRYGGITVLPGEWEQKS
jgi:hypothetical protein